MTLDDAVKKHGGGRVQPRAVTRTARAVHDAIGETPLRIAIGQAYYDDLDDDGQYEVDEFMQVQRERLRRHMLTTAAKNADVRQCVALGGRDDEDDAAGFGTIAGFDD